jgi:hypothetical protein
LFLAVCLLAAPVGEAASIEVPLIAQQQIGCGAAETAMVMRYWAGKGFGVPENAADAAAICDRLDSGDADGIAGSRIGDYFRGQGFESYVFEGGWDDLAWHIERGRPLIVGVRSGEPTTRLRYLVVAGLDEQQQSVLVNDTAGAELNRIDRQIFENDWKAGGNWALLALPQQPQ